MTEWMSESVNEWIHINQTPPPKKQKAQLQREEGNQISYLII